jgi:Na+-driven multidrug efflux pump
MHDPLASVLSSGGHLPTSIASPSNSSCSSIFLIFKDKWAYLFNSDPAVVQMTAYVMPLVALFQVFDGLGVVTGGILRAKGQQTVGAVLNLVGYYIVGIPVGLLLAFHAGMGIYGLWTGLTIALVLVAGFGVWGESVVSFLLAESPDSVVYSSLHGH